VKGRNNMDFLKRNNWWLCLIINLLTFGLFYIILAKFMNLYDKDAWYMNKWYWIIGGLCLIFPLFVMLMIFGIEMNAKVAMNLEVSGSNIYYNPYVWIACVIVPVIGWSLLLVMWFYILILPNTRLADGYGEKFIK
jgi:hypothetical protein